MTFKHICDCLPDLLANLQRASGDACKGDSEADAAATGSEDTEQAAQDSSGASDDGDGVEHSGLRSGGAALLGQLGLGSVGGASAHHFLQRHGAASEVAHAQHEFRGHPFIGDLADPPRGDIEVSGERLVPPALLIKPSLKFHLVTLDEAKAEVNGFLKFFLYDSLNMDDIEAHRKRRLADLIAKRFGGVQKEFASAAGISEGRVTQLLSAKESFGERSAAKIARALSLAPRYFEQEDKPTPGASPPPVPPRNFRDRHDVSESDFALLQAVHMTMSDEEKKSMLKKAEHALAVALEQIGGLGRKTD